MLLYDVDDESDDDYGGKVWLMGQRRDVKLRDDWEKEKVKLMSVTAVDIQQLEQFADRIFANVGIDVEFTKHFKDRVNSERNAKPIVPAELTRLFKQERKRYGKPIAQMGPDSEAVMRDLQTDINVPFALVLDKENDELDLIAKTVMRKKDFSTPNRVFAVEDSPFRIGTRYEMPRKSVRTGVKESTGQMMSSEQMLAKLSKEMQGTHTGAMNTNSDWSKFVLSHKKFTLKDVQVDQIPTAVKSDGMSQANIEKYKQADLSKFPPMVIGNDGYILDGNHRLQAYKAQGIKTVKAYIGEESEIWQWNKEDPNNPEVHIQGYGRLMLNQIEDSIVGKLKELTKMAERGDFEQIQSLLDRDVMQSMMKAVVDTKAELQATRKRGGPKSRGINRESILDVVGESKIEEFELNEFTLVDVKDMIKKGWMARPTEKQWKELVNMYNKYKGNVTRKDLLDLGIATLGRKESVKEKQEKTDDLKAFDPRTTRALNMLKTKYPQADNILSALLADVETNEKDNLKTIDPSLYKVSLE